MRFTFLLLFGLFSFTAWCQGPNLEAINGFGNFDRLIFCPVQTQPTAMPFLGFGNNCFMRSFNRINVVAPEMDAIINSDQNPALLHQPSPYQAIKIDYTPLEADFNFTDIYALKASIQKQFRQGSSWDLRYENFSVAPSLGLSENSSAKFAPSLQVVRLAYAKTISKHWSMGLAAKYASQKPKETNFFQSVRKTDVLAADLGFKYQNSKAMSESQQLSWQWGFSLSNLGPKVKSEIEDNFQHPLPTMLSAGFLLEQKTQLSHTALLHIRGSYQLNKLLTPGFCDDCDENLNTIPDYLDYSAVGGMLASFTDAPGGLTEELQEINHQFDMGAVYSFNEKFGLRTQLTLFYQNPNKGAIQYLATQIGMQWGKIQLDFIHYNSFRHPDNGKLGLSLGYQHFLTPS